MSPDAIQLTTPLEAAALASLKALDRVELTGTIYTARDAAHARIVSTIEAGGEPPFDLDGAIVYYVGPTPAPPGSGRPIGSAGPTTSARMDGFTPYLLERGLRATIGKGPRSKECVDAMVKHGAVYFAAIGGAGALLAKAIKSAEIVAYEELGTEAVRRLEVEALPLIVAVDTRGASAYESGPQAYLAGQ